MVLITPHNFPQNCMAYQKVHVWHNDSGSCSGTKALKCSQSDQVISAISLNCVDLLPRSS